MNIILHILKWKDRHLIREEEGIKVAKILKVPKIGNLLYSQNMKTLFRQSFGQRFSQLILKAKKGRFFFSGEVIELRILNNEKKNVKQHYVGRSSDYICVEMLKEIAEAS